MVIPDDAGKARAGAAHNPESATTPKRAAIKNCSRIRTRALFKFFIINLSYSNDDHGQAELVTM
jgi:hypothetical protein